MRSRALEIQARSGEYAALLGRFEAIGVDAAELNTVTQRLASQRKLGDRPGEQGLSEGDVSSLLSELGEIEERMAGVVTTSEGLANDARSADFDDLHRKTDALRQQLLAARNRIGLLKEALVKAVPRTSVFLIALRDRARSRRVQAVTVRRTLSRLSTATGFTRWWSNPASRVRR